MDPASWSLIFTFLMVAVLIIEIMVPSMGVLSVIALGLMGVSVYMAFQHSAQIGYTMLGIDLLLIPVSIYFAQKLVKDSPMALRSEIQAGVPQEVVTPGTVHPLVGQTGKVLTTLRPSGAVMIGEQRLDVISEGKFVEAGTTVKVLRVAGDIIVVEPV